MVRVQARVVQARVATQTEPRVRRLCLGRQVIHSFLASEERIVRSHNKSIATDTCWQDCVGVGALNMVSNPSCLSDCFPPDHCLTSLVRDFTAAGGVCPDSYVDRYYSDLWPTSSRSCLYLRDGDTNFDVTDRYRIRTGVCSPQTELALQDQENCVKPLFSQREDILMREEFSD